VLPSACTVMESIGLAKSMVNNLYYQLLQCHVSEVQLFTFQMGESAV